MTVEAVRKAVVPLVCLSEGSGPTADVKKIMGTGFFISREGHFLTAAHVIASIKSFPGCDPAIYVPTVSWKDRPKVINYRWFSFKQCYFSGPTDIAACKTVNNPFTVQEVKGHLSYLRFRSFVGYNDGSTAAFTGFPLEQPFPITSIGHVAAYDAAQDRIVIDKAAWPGASGSPVYDPQGRVVGMLVQGGVNEGAGLAFARPSDAILKILREQKIPVEQ